MSSIEEKQHYDFALNLQNPANVHRIELAMIPAGSSVLDVGCHTGILGEVLKQQKGCKVTGIDSDPKAVKKASERLDAAFIANIECDGWSEEVRRMNPNGFDRIVFGDVLEHTRQPEAILREVKTLLKHGGQVIVSVPNVANLRIRLGLLMGRFDYKDSGILDRTHLRFFTIRSAQALLQAAGFSVAKVEVAGYQLPHWLIKLFPGMLAVQIVMLGRPQEEG